MILARPSDARGITRAGGLSRRHVFSRGDHFDPAWTGFGALRALEEIEFPPGAALSAQRCANMELLTVVLAGTLAVEGEGLACELREGQAHWLGAGDGVEAGWRNASAHAPLRLLQWWLQPGRLNAVPASAQAAFVPGEGEWASLDLPVRQQARLLATSLRAGDAIALEADAVHRYWLHLASGGIEGPGGRVLHAGDGIGLEAEDGRFALRGLARASEAFLLELPA